MQKQKDQETSREIKEKISNVLENFRINKQ